MPDTDFSFDARIAGLYNRQRAHPEDVSRSIGEAITMITGENARVLEMGVGTGRIAYPVAAAGARVVGFDLSAEMLAHTAANQQPDRRGNLALLQANMEAMPFASNIFDAVLAVHVLHLSKDLARVLHEIGRVLHSGGAFIQGNDWMDPESVIGALRDHLRTLAMKHAKNLMPPSAGVPLAQTLAELGGTEVSEQIAAEWTVYISPEERLQAVANKIDAESWIIPDHLFDTILGELREFAAQRWPDLEAKQAVTRRFTLKVTRGTW